MMLQNLIHFCIFVLTYFYSCSGQHWWNFEDVIDKQRTPVFTPVPGSRFTHETVRGEFSAQPNDVQVNIPKAGLGSFIGYSTWVDYDYTWTQWPPLKGRQVNVFLGIPYAARPIGDERFRLPRPSYLDTRYSWYAKRYKPACLQNPVHMRSQMPGFNSFSEDCLYLNVFYPNRTWDPPTTRYPVIVHIHGGSFVYGSSHLYPGHALASMGVVVVTFNYRLSFFGFLSTGDLAAQGNYGLWDQVQALQWVRKYIWWFRGNPDRITVMGESAGGASVSLLLQSPITRNLDLFHQAIIMSGSDLSPWAVSDPSFIRPQYYAKELGRRVNCPTHDHYALIYCLRYHKNSQKLVNESINIKPLNGAPIQIWSPVVDGSVGFLPRSPWIVRKYGDVQKIPVLVGVVHDEGSMVANEFLNHWFKQKLTDYLDEDTFRECTKRFAAYTNSKRIEETAEELYFRYTWWSNPNNLTARKQEFIAMLSDYFINAPVDATLRSQAPYTPNAYFYEYAYRGMNDTSSKDFGIYHGVEIPFLFGFPFMNKSWWTTHMAPNPIPLQVNQIWNYPYDTNMSEFTMMLWTNFAKLSDPTPWEIQNVTWLPYTVQKQNYLHIYINSSVLQNFRQSHLAFWRERYENISDIEPASKRYIWYPIFDVQIITYVFAILLIFVIIGIIILSMALCRRPDPDEFVETVGLGGNQFAAVFKDTFAGYGEIEATDV